MSAPLKSYDPVVQSIYDAIAAHDNQAVPGLLEQWKAAGGRPKDGSFFYQACCKKQGAGLVRLLAAAGLPCDQEALDLAINRKCWHVAQALLPAIPKLAQPGRQLDGPAAPFSLFNALLEGQLELAQALLPLYPDQRAAVNATLHNLVRVGSRRVPQAAPAIAWLVEQGADPNEPLIRMTPPLEAALTGNHIECALELIACGASLHGFRNGMEKVVACAYHTRIDDPTHATNPRFSPLGWQLLEVALQAGFRLPQLISSQWGARYFEGFDKFSGRLHEDDADRVEVLRQAVSLDAATGLSAAPVRSPRL